MCMNILEVQQPFASMLVRSLRDVAQIEEWHLQKSRRFYIYSSGFVINDAAMPFSWQQEVFNQQQYGNLAETEELPVNALLGYVDWIAHADPHMNLWSVEISGPSEHVYNAHVFDAPLMLPLSSIELMNGLDRILPSHVARVPQPYLAQCGQELVIPVSDRNFAIASRGGSFLLEMTSTLSILLSEMDDITLVTVVNGLRAKSFLFNADLIHTKNNLDDSDENDERERVQLLLKFNYPH